MDKGVTNPVDKLEDNNVDNPTTDEKLEITWLKDWSEYLTQAPFMLRERNSAQIAKLLQVLIEASLNGDSGLPIYSSDLPDSNEFILNEEQASNRVAPLVYADDMLMLYRYWSLEQRLANEIVRLATQTIQPVATEQYSHLLIEEKQQAALNTVAANAFNIITGGPGTGKTYTLARIIAVLSQQIPDIRIALAAPTGKAAQRMQEALQASFNDEKLIESGLINDTLKQQGTQTLHRLLGLGHRKVPRFNAKQPLPYDVVVIDEASMLDLNLATLLMEAIPHGCRLILLGDAQQLASVDVGAVLADLQQVEKLAANRVHLVASRRFSADAKIGQFAQFIQHVPPQSSETDILQAFEQNIATPQTITALNLSQLEQDVVQLEYLPDHIEQEVNPYYERLMYGFESFIYVLKQYLQADEKQTHIANVIKAFDEYRILVAIRYGKFGLTKINQFAEQWLLQQLKTVAVGGWYVGRPVMMTYNDYQLGISNGDIGVCFLHHSEPSQFEVFFPSLNKWVAAHRLPKNMQTAFALTIHKSQGSEFRHVAVTFDQFAQKMMSQELIYTAITRAKGAVSLLVSPDALAQSFLKKTTRKSGLIRKINKKFILLS